MFQRQPVQYTDLQAKLDTAYAPAPTNAFAAPASRGTVRVDAGAYATADSKATPSDYARGNAYAAPQPTGNVGATTSSDNAYTYQLGSRAGADESLYAAYGAQ